MKKENKDKEMKKKKIMSKINLETKYNYYF